MLVDEMDVDWCSVMVEFVMGCDVYWIDVVNEVL